jgi:hypothetical protein
VKRISGTQWDKLCEVYRARLNRERGLRASLKDATLNNLYRRGLVTGRDVDGFDGWLWSCTAAGEAAVLEGPSDGS